MPRYDVIVIGGGHNGLTTAALLAARGRKVVLLERRPVLGGLAVGDVVAVESRKSRLILTHGEIKGFMAAMEEMSFMVTPSTLLQGIEPGNKVRFTIDADKRVIVDVVPLDR